MTLDTVLFYAGLVVEATAIFVLFRQKITRILPVFSIYVVYSLVNDLGMLILSKRFPGSYSTAYYAIAFGIELPLDSILQFGVLVELAWSVLKPYRQVLPRSTIVAVALVILIAGAAVWPLTGAILPHNAPLNWRTLMRIQQSFTILRILFFVVLAALSRFLAIGWRNRELQVATGLGIYSLVSLGAALIQTHSISTAQFQTVEDLVIASYICSMLYWIFSFLQKEAPRQEFTPRMQTILLTVAGAARANRVAVEDLRKSQR